MEASRQDDAMPPPTPELVLIGSITLALLRQMETRAEREALIRDVTDLMSAQRRLGNVVRLRPVEYEEALSRAQAEAAEWWSAIAPVLVARV